MRTQIGSLLVLAAIFLCPSWAAAQVNPVAHHSTLASQLGVAPNRGNQGVAADGAMPALNGPALANDRYYQLVSRQLEQLNVAGNLNNYASLPQQYEAAAKRITRLSTAQVDPEIAKAAANMAQRLRSHAKTVRGLVSQLQELERQRWYSYYQDPPQIYYSYGGWTGGVLPPKMTGTPLFTWGTTPGQVHFTNNFADVNLQEQPLLTKIEQERSTLEAELRQEQQQMRQALAAKFGAGFGVQ